MCALPSYGKHTLERVLQAYHDAVDEVCGYHERDALRIEPHAPSSELVFASVQHNGLGNQLFQYAVGRLLARALGARFVARRIEDFEGPMTTKLPPHSGQSFEDFEEIFALNSRAAAQFERERCARLVPTRGEYAANGTILLAQRPADTRRVRLSVALAAIAHRGTQLKCVRAIGYFQDYALLSCPPRLLLKRGLVVLGSRVESKKSKKGLSSLSLSLSLFLFGFEIRI